MSDPALILENQLCFPLYAAARKVTGLYTPYLKEIGLTYTQYLVMMVLWEKDGIRISDICGRLRLDTGTVTPMLKKMEDEGLLKRSRCADDERTVLITLTEQGLGLKEKAGDIPAKVGPCVPLNKEEAELLYRLLYQILSEEA
ncbi:MAG: MarR family transcriptional regulator [Solobacterium sp.]|nr:MarR family transcriptional regulator [Bacillota bacterium]MBQ6489172.1 MarR family transcriptional regulator [Solobacterium sp.]